MKELPLVRRPYFANRILDIGGGHNPFRGVTHVLDMDIVFGRERGGVTNWYCPGGHPWSREEQANCRSRHLHSILYMHRTCSNMSMIRNKPAKNSCVLVVPDSLKPLLPCWNMAWPLETKHRKRCGITSGLFFLLPPADSFLNQKV